MIWHWGLFLSLVVSCCKPVPVSPAPTSLDGSAPPSCAVACAHLEALGCPESKPSRIGEDCKTVCERVQASRMSWIDLACISAAPDSHAASLCEGIRCK